MVIEGETTEAFMDDDSASAIANEYLENRGLSISNMAPVVENPAPREIEVSFRSTAEDGGPKTPSTHRVFMTQFGHFLGLVLADGSVPLTPPNADLEQIIGQDLVDAATRYLAAHDVETSDLVAQRVDPPQLLLVWYQQESDVAVMGGGFEVYMTLDGTVVRSYRSQ